MSDPLEIRLEAVRRYHQRTKHCLDGFAAGPGRLDWATQPEPFRWFEGAPSVELPLVADGLGTAYVDLYRKEQVAPQPLSLESIAALFELSLGLSAWKQSGDTRWPLRCNPSSGNLHPTEGYAVVPNVGPLSAGVYHYLSRDHLLEQRCVFGNSALPPHTLLIGLSSIHWREAWKYGERAYRYCQLDCGHAMAAIRYAAAVLGWSVRLLDHWDDESISQILGLDRKQDFAEAEQEHPDLMLLVETMSSTTAMPLPDELLKAAEESAWQGQANPLSPYHSNEWPEIDLVAEACLKPQTTPARWVPSLLPAPQQSDCRLAAATLIRQRRSAQAFDGETAITASQLYRMLDVTLPRPATPPWDLLSWLPRIHLLLFVHRVDGLPPGLYLFMRRDEVEMPLQSALANDAFEWGVVDGCPNHLKLYQLLHTDARELAEQLSCRQAIAADSAFSLGMLAEFEGSLESGPWGYRQLYWEAGMLGQLLYLEAEAAGVSGTGIGCYFDDALHASLGIEGTQFQSLYHFTVGGALQDQRLITLPPYAHLGTEL